MVPGIKLVLNVTRERTGLAQDATSLARCVQILISSKGINFPFSLMFDKLISQNEEKTKPNLDASGKFFYSQFWCL